MVLLEELNKFFSTIEDTEETVVAGIDEAGRGPVLGPMVYAIYVMRPSAATRFRDSKLLSAAERERLFATMQRQPGKGGVSGYAYLAVAPEYITSHMEGGSLNLNAIARGAVLRLLAELSLRCRRVSAVYVDGLGNNTAYAAFLSAHFPFRFVVENKADSTYQVVSGASIVAKVTRDAFVAPLGAGSGYPGDPKTKAWLRLHRNAFSGFPACVRHSWATAKALLPQKRSRKLGGRLEGFFTAPA